MEEGERLNVFANLQTEKNFLLKNLGTIYLYNEREAQEESV